MNELHHSDDALLTPKIDVYDISKYTFIEKLPHKPARDVSVKAKLERMKVKFDRMGTLRSVECVLIAHHRNALHALVLHEPATGRYRLPGGKKHSLETDMDAMQRHLRKLLGKPEEFTGPYATSPVEWNTIPAIETRLFENEDEFAVKTAPADAEKSAALGVNFQLSDATQTEAEAARVRYANSFKVHSCIAEWTRPNFEMVVYPYAPPHVSVPKETKRIFVFQMPSSFTFCVPKNYTVVAVPVYELYGNPERFGSAILSGLPACLSKLNCTMSC